MATVTITITGELDEMKGTGFLNSDLWGQEETAPAEETTNPQTHSVDLFDPDLKAEKQFTPVHTITGFKKIGPNWKVKFQEPPKGWTVPCESSGAGNSAIVHRLFAFFIDDIETPIYNELDVQFKKPVTCKVEMYLSDRGKFAGEWCWTKITRI